MRRKVLGGHYRLSGKEETKVLGGGGGRLRSKEGMADICVRCSRLSEEVNSDRESKLRSAMIRSEEVETKTEREKKTER